MHEKNIVLQNRIFLEKYWENYKETELFLKIVQFQQNTQNKITLNMWGSDAYYALHINMYNLPPS